MDWIETINNIDRDLSQNDVNVLVSDVCDDILLGFNLLEGKMRFDNCDVADRFASTIIAALPNIQVRLIKECDASDEETSQAALIAMNDALLCFDLIGDTTIGKLLISAFALGIKYSVDMEIR